MRVGYVQEEDRSTPRRAAPVESFGTNCFLGITRKLDVKTNVGRSMIRTSNEKRKLLDSRRLICMEDGNWVFAKFSNENQKSSIVLRKEEKEKKKERKEKRNERKLDLAPDIVGLPRRNFKRFLEKNRPVDSTRVSKFMEIRESSARALWIRRIKASYPVGDELLWLMEKLIWNSVLPAWQRRIRTPLRYPAFSSNSVSFRTALWLFTQILPERFFSSRNIVVRDKVICRRIAHLLFNNKVPAPFDAQRWLNLRSANMETSHLRRCNRTPASKFLNSDFQTRLLSSLIFDPPSIHSKQPC